MVTLRRNLLSRFGAAVMLTLSSGIAVAHEEKIEPSATPPTSVSTAVESPEFDISVGAAFATDYVSRGITNNDSNPVIQGYVEPSLGMAYVNLWASPVDY